MNSPTSRVKTLTKTGLPNTLTNTLLFIILSSSLSFQFMPGTSPLSQCGPPF